MLPFLVYLEVPNSSFCHEGTKWVKGWSKLHYEKFSVNQSCKIDKENPENEYKDLSYEYGSKKLKNKSM